MPTHNASVHSTAASLPTAAAAAAPGAVGTIDGGDGDGDSDERTYCFCDLVGMGEMLACDEVNCEREWYHLVCVGLTAVPDGYWFCDSCKNRKMNKRTMRGAKQH